MCPAELFFCYICEMAKASIHIQPVKENSEAHNQRRVDLDYVNSPLNGITDINERFKILQENNHLELNESWEVDTISNRFKAISELYEKNVGQKLQKKATPIREAVINLKKDNTIWDLRELARRLEKRFGIKAFQIYDHRDEGHHDKNGVWKPNYHAHMVFDWTNDQGKTLKLDKHDMAEMQTIVADTLGMERGISSDLKHLNAVQFKIAAEEKKLQEMINDQKLIKENINDILSGKVKIQDLKIDQNDRGLKM